VIPLAHLLEAKPWGPRRLSIPKALTFLAVSSLSSSPFSACAAIAWQHGVLVDKSGVTLCEG